MGLWVIAACMTLLVVQSTGRVRETVEPDRFPRTQLLRQLTSTRASERAEGLHRTLLQSDDTRAVDVVIEAIDKLAKSQQRRGWAAQLVQSMSKLPSTPAARVALLRWVEHEDLAMVMSALEPLAARGDRSIPVQLVRLSRREEFLRHFGFRVLLVSIAVRGDRQHVGWLLDHWDDFRGLDRQVMLRHLRRIAGHDHGESVGAWRRWWAAGGVKSVDAAAEVPKGPTGPTYFGMPIDAKRMVFVVDKSGSMEDPLDAAMVRPARSALPPIPNPPVTSRLRQAQLELLSAIQQLPADAHFGVVVFDERVSVWRPRLAVANEPNKRSAAQFVARITADGQTAWYDALQAAMRLDANLEAIYFLSDGVPTVGSIVSAPQILAAIERQNYYRRITISTIGLGVDVSAERFLRTLAAMNAGRYESVGVGQAEAMRKLQPAKDVAAFDPQRVLKRPMPPLKKVRALSARKADRRLKPDELVLGVTIGEQSRAYPINMLTGPSREILNDRVGGSAIAATW